MNNGLTILPDGALCHWNGVDMDSLDFVGPYALVIWDKGWGVDQWAEFLETLAA